MGVLSLIPKQVWLYMLAGLSGAMFIATAYHKGYEAGGDKQILKQKAIVEEEVSKALASTEKELEEALLLQAEKRRQVISLNEHLNTSEREAKKLQEALDEVINKSPDTSPGCDVLPPPYIRLYEEMYNKRPSSGED